MGGSVQSLVFRGIGFRALGFLMKDHNGFCMFARGFATRRIPKPVTSKPSIQYRPEIPIQVYGALLVLGIGVAIHHRTLNPYAERLLGVGFGP